VYSRFLEDFSFEKVNIDIFPIEIIDLIERMKLVIFVDEDNVRYKILKSEHFKI
jgi:hypothetical protein